MRLALSFLAALVVNFPVQSTARSRQRGDKTSRSVLPADVFGQLDPGAVDNLVCAKKRSESLHRLFEPSLGRSVQDCRFPIDIHILQDATGSFQDDFRVAANETIPALAPIFYYHRGSTVSLSMFRDKPLDGLGEYDDYCFKPKVMRSQNLRALSAAYDEEYSSGGWDLPENQYGAIIQAIKSPKTVPWMAEGATKLLIMITDSPPHFGGDGHAKESEFKPFDGFNEKEADASCLEYYYPQPDHVADALAETGVHLGIIIQRPDDQNGQSVKAWRWFNGFIGQEDRFLVESRGALAGWTHALLEIVTTLRKAECGEDVPPIPDVPVACHEAADEDVCHGCDANSGCCDFKSLPRVLIAVHNPPEDLNITVKLPSQ